MICSKNCNISALKLGDSVGLRGDGFLELDRSMMPSPSPPASPVAPAPSSSSSIGGGRLDGITVKFSTEEEDGLLLWQGTEQGTKFMIVTGNI